MNPIYCARLTGKHLTGSDVSCTADQLLLLINGLPELKSHCWFLADINFTPSSDVWSGFTTFKPKLFGETKKLLECATVDGQFLSGVFLAVKASNIFHGVKNEYDTEDKPFTDIEAADIQIRAVDTSYFEIYTHDKKEMEPLLALYGGEIVNG